jgi:2-keto-3-deoxy-L-rhamnonate aldolase RhmA
MKKEKTSASESRKNKSTTGIMIRMVTNPGIALMAKNVGFDFIMVDMEHGDYSWPQVSAIATTGQGAGMRVYARVPELSRGNVSRALDCGITGVMVPMLETVEQAKQLVKWAKYPPIGERGYSSIGAMGGYRTVSDISGTMAMRNEEVVTIAQIETAAGVEAAARIAAVPGVDALLVGPYDLSISLGCPGDFTCEKERRAIETAAHAAKSNGKIFGMHAGMDLLKQWRPEGLQILMCGVDITLLSKGMQSIANDLASLVGKEG